MRGRLDIGGKADRIYLHQKNTRRRMRYNSSVVRCHIAALRRKARVCLDPPTNRCTRSLQMTSASGGSSSSSQFSTIAPHTPARPSGRVHICRCRRATVCFAQQHDAMMRCAGLFRGFIACCMQFSSYDVRGQSICRVAALRRLLYSSAALALCPPASPVVALRRRQALVAS